MSPRLRVAFVSAPGSSAFMAEILHAVADAVTRADPDLEVLNHHGVLDDVVDARTVGVVVPHEYFAVADTTSAAVLARTVSFGVEHPGTETFETSARHAARLGARFEISAESLAHLQARGLTAGLFPLGYSPTWDRWHAQRSPARDVDLVYLGTADPRRTSILARQADRLAGLRTEILLPPHEPMTARRPDFLLASEKWELLARSKVLLNLHRDEKTAFERVRGIEAMTNGCVVLTEPSSDLDPFVPGTHLLVAEPADLGAVLRAALADPEQLRAMAEAAHALCRDQLDMSEAARSFLAAVRELDRTTAAPPPPPVDRPMPRPTPQAPLALWVPGQRALPPDRPAPDPQAAGTDLRLRRLEQQTAAAHATGQGRPSARLDVLCVAAVGTGPWRETVRSLPPGVGALVAAADGGLVTADGDPVHTAVTWDRPVGRAGARNDLAARSGADLLAVLDAGDTVLPGALEDLIAAFDRRPELDVAFCLATHGGDQLANALVPEARRLARGPYLERGYVIRRSVLLELGGFEPDPLVDDHVDHVFWCRAVAAGLRIELRRSIGIALWRRRAVRPVAELDPAAVRARLLREVS